jgi:5-methylcytosine-specific restriction protein B
VPRLDLAAGVYTTVDQIRTRCIEQNLSLLWPTTPVWTAQNFAAAWEAIIGHPDLGPGSFMSKLEGQLEGNRPDVYRLVADLLTFYLLYPSTVRAAGKNAIITEVVGWKLADDPPQEQTLKVAFERGIGSAGLYYNLRRDLQLGFYIAFFRELLKRGSTLTDASEAQEIADNVAVPALLQSGAGMTTSAGVSAARNIALSVFFPDDYEPIASDRHKQLVLKHWQSLSGGAADLDVALKSIRTALTPEFGEGFGYYSNEIEPLWQSQIAESAPKPKPGAHPVDELHRLSADTNLTTDELQVLELLLTEKQQLVLYGPPGSGKTYLAQLFAKYFTLGREDHIELIQFHQSYGYEDFIQGIRPMTSDSGRLSYAVVAGAFKEFCERARGSEGRYVMILDEINRGNVSRIFGELLLALEYRNIPIKLAGSQDSEGKWSIPENVYIIGTMNTADRSLAQLDYALRRRFYFYRLDPVRAGRAPVLERWLAGQGLSFEDQNTVLALFLALNSKVIDLLGDDYQIGHSYFMVDGIATPEGRAKVWKWAVSPLLDEYLYNRRDRAALLAQMQPDQLLPGTPSVEDSVAT